MPTLMSLLMDLILLSPDEGAFINIWMRLKVRIIAEF